ncbi:MAG: RraA family protein [Chloroflexi bacterium]|nr:RraA family protein [Chloroflexota bacterium]
MSAILTPEQLAVLRAIDSPTVANAIEAFQVRDRTVGFPTMDVRCQFPELGITLGYAVTATADSTTPGKPRGRAGMLKLWEAVDASPKPVVIVVKDVGPEPRRSCHCGDVMANTARRLGAIALVTDGGVRDLAEVRALGFQFFAPGPVVSHGNFGIIDVNLPVQLHGCWVQPGDLLHGDANGIVVIPAEVAERVADEVEKVRSREGKIISYVNSPEFSLEGLRKLYGM